MMQKITLSTLVLVLSGCAVMERGRDRLFGRDDPLPAAQPVPAPVAQRMPGADGALTAAALDTTTAAERAAALSVAPPAGAALGTVRVTLGNPTEAGFWLQSALVTAPGKGRVEAEGGASVAVDLRPGSGGAQLSLAAFRALGLALTGLPEVTVYAD